MAFKALQKTVSELLTGSILEIPRNQRRYVWKEEHWNDLLNDLDFAISNNEQNKKHFIGSIVLKEENSINGIKHYTIIDGQQRTFTIVLFLSSIMQLFKERKMEDDFMGNLRLLISIDLKNQSSCIINSDYYLSLSSIVRNICNWKNNFSLNEILNLPVVNKQIEKPIINCLLFYYNELKKRNDNDIIMVRNALIETNFVEIIATTEEDSYIWYATFERKYGELYNHYDYVNIGWIPGINEIYSYSVESKKFENNPVELSKEDAIKIAEEKDKQIEPDAQIKEIKADIRIEKMNSDAYEREKFGDEYQKQRELPVGEKTYYITEERVRKVWIVTLKYDKIEEGELCDYSYFVDATTGEIIGGEPWDYFTSESDIDEYNYIENGSGLVIK